MGSVSPHALSLSAAADFGLIELNSASGLRAQLLPSGTLFALRHRETLLNQVLPGPAEEGLFRLLVRWKDASGQVAGWAPLVGREVDFATAGPVWRTSPRAGLECVTTLTLHPQHAAWAWRVQLHNTSGAPLTCEIFHAQDLGLADEGAVRNNEAYVSQYLDLLPVVDAALGHVILARQNQPAAGGRHPWAAFACAEGAAAFCTDAYQFLGADFRLTGEPLAMREPSLPSRRLQYECALAGLQTHPLALAPGATATTTFVARFLEDHPAASVARDLTHVAELLPAHWASAPQDSSFNRAARSVFTAPWLHGENPVAPDLAGWFPVARRHEEFDAQRHLLSFFCGTDTHVVLRAKEALVARPHGHIVRNGASLWIDDGQFGVTGYAAGIFGAQVYLGNPSIARFLSVVRHPLNLARASGQRVFVRRAGEWCQLGVPSAFVMEPGRVRWIYRLPDATVEAALTCSGELAASFLTLAVTAGAPCEFLVTHSLALGANEFDARATLEINAAAGWMAALPSPSGFLAQHLPHTCFALAAIDPAQVAEFGGDELLYADNQPRGGPYAAVRSVATNRFALALVGTHAGLSALEGAVAAARAEFSAERAPARPPLSPVRLGRSHDAGVARVDDVLPWFTHNASIHFSTPHGLEQYGGAAWGVRDVTQGSIEWLLAAGEFDVARRVLETVFAQQYLGAAARAEGVEGAWPQWFMFPPFHFIQQAHSHGDVCFWPVKALCDYVEATNDLGFLNQGVDYTEAKGFTPAGARESLWVHCDRVVAHVESRLVPGTALVNYGDGDWDDTLQPADPTMRTRMVSAWTVALAYQTFRQLATVSRRAGESARADVLEALLARMRRDFGTQLMPGGTVAGFLVNEPDGSKRPLLHPGDKITGIRYRLLPMTRSVIAELFTPDEANHHLAIVERDLKFADGVRLMSEPATYHGGLEKLFKRGETAANVGREIGLQYVHAHIRYAEAMAKIGDADRLWEALQVVNPVGLDQVVSRAAPRQSNVYFSSSDADFADRVEAAARWPELRAGRVAVRGGWRLYSSGPGLYLHKVRACLLGLRESFGDIVFDPVLPRSLDGLTAETHLCGRPVRIVYTVRSGTHAPQSVRVNGQPLAGLRDPNPYRAGGLRVAAALVSTHLQPQSNLIEISL